MHVDILTVSNPWISSPHCGEEGERGGRLGERWGGGGGQKREVERERKRGKDTRSKRERIETLYVHVCVRKQTNLVDQYFDIYINQFPMF